jgi:hypothetical protein
VVSKWGLGVAIRILGKGGYSVASFGGFGRYKGVGGLEGLIVAEMWRCHNPDFFTNPSSLTFSICESPISITFFSKISLIAKARA